MDLAVVVMVARSNDIDDLRPLMPKVRDALLKAKRGQIVKVQT